jgi:TorA maturation chaperone TorD
MTLGTNDSAAQSLPTRLSANEADTVAHAGHIARALAYRSLCELVASPASQAWGVDSVRATVENLAQAALSLPFAFECAALEECALRSNASEIEHAALDYGAQFEVGGHGPPLPIRAELAPGANPASKEELSRFYEHFGYEVGEQDAWQLDHLAVQLEFLHLLSFGAAAASDPASALSYQCANRDVLRRHVLPWFTPMVDKLATADVQPYLRAVMLATAQFVLADHDWLNTVCSEE